MIILMKKQVIFSFIIDESCQTKKEKNKQKIYFMGNGKARRELIHVDDIADACIYFMNKKSENIINIGVGKDKRILDYAKIIMKILKMKNKIYFDLSKPNGVKRKLLDISLAKIWLES